VFIFSRINCEKTGKRVNSAAPSPVTSAVIINITFHTYYRTLKSQIFKFLSLCDLFFGILLVR
jgi:hypothetical protein